jgi:hypothetical protein
VSGLGAPGVTAPVLTLGAAAAIARLPSRSVMLAVVARSGAGAGVGSGAGARRAVGATGTGAMAST